MHAHTHPVSAAPDLAGLQSGSFGASFPSLGSVRERGGSGVPGSETGGANELIKVRASSRDTGTTSEAASVRRLSQPNK